MLSLKIEDIRVRTNSFMKVEDIRVRTNSFLKIEDTRVRTNSFLLQTVGYKFYLLTCKSEIDAQHNTILV